MTGSFGRAPLGEGGGSSNPPALRSEQAPSEPEDRRAPSVGSVQPALPRLARNPRLLPLAAILCLQAALSVSLVWSNTAFGAEASYLVEGRLEWSHWFHGSPVPAFTGSGAPQIYPPLGALADSLGGLAGARILSLCFMLSATALLYRVAQRLFGDWAAITGAALWAVSAPVLSLALATSAPLSCFLVAAAAWATVQAGSRRRRGAFVALAAALLVLASTAAFSLAVMIPAVVAFAFFVWQSSLGTRMATWWAIWLAGGTIIITAGLWGLLHLWTDAVGASFTGAKRTSGGDAISLVHSVWLWEGLMFALAAAGVAATFTSAHDRNRRLLLVTFFASGLLVPIYQAAIGTGWWPLDERMSAGTWFLAIGAGYAAATLVPLSRWKWTTAGTALALFLVYPVVIGTFYARSGFRAWPNVAALVAQMRPLVDEDPGRIFATTTNNTDTILQYYLLHGDDWQRWQPVSSGTPSIEHAHPSFVVLELSGSFDSAELPEGATHYSQKPPATEILQLASGNGQLSLAKELMHSRNYDIRLTTTYKTGYPASRTGIFVLWQRTSMKG